MRLPRDNYALQGNFTGGIVPGLTMSPDGRMNATTATGGGWIGASTGNATGDRVVSGNVGGRATLGGRESSLGDWVPLYLNPSGNVSIGTTSPSQKLSVAGSITATGTIGSASGRRYKERFAPLPNALPNVLQLNGLTCYWRRAAFPAQHFGPERQLGFIAQDVEKLYPELVVTDAAGYKSVDYGRLTPVLVEAIKKQQAQIEALKAAATGAKAEAEAAGAASTTMADLLRRVQALGAPGTHGGR